MHKERIFLESEITELKRLLAAIPEENVIDRMGFEHRLMQAEEALQHMQNTPIPETMTITFKGKPVRGTHGVYADFATKAMGRLSDTFAAFVANAKGITLGHGGVIPEIDKHKLLITGTALGSFGFELELPTPKPESLPVQGKLLPEESPIVKARDMLERVIEQSLEGDDDQLAEALEEVELRALHKLRGFYETLRKNDAIFSLKIGAREIRCPSVDIVEQASSRLKKENIKTSPSFFTGKLIGVLPQSRDFEFEDTAYGIIKGKIDEHAGDISNLVWQWSQKTTRICLQQKIVGRGKPRYRLASLYDIVEVESDVQQTITLYNE